VVRTVHSDTNVHSLLFTLTHRAQDLAGADKCTLFLVDHGREQLVRRTVYRTQYRYVTSRAGICYLILCRQVVMQSELELRIPIHKGIAGYVARTGHTLNIPDAYQDNRFNPEVCVCCTLLRSSASDCDRARLAIVSMCSD